VLLDAFFIIIFFLIELSKISIIIPVYNEVDTIEKIVNKILRKNKKLFKEIILIDDASNDGTQDIIKNKLFKKVNTTIFHKINKGKGSAIKSGKKKIKGDIVIIQDADLEYDPGDYLKLIKPIINLESKVVYGSRVLGKKRYKAKNFISLSRVFFNHVLTIFSNVINNQKLTDAHTCYKVFSFDVFKKIKLEEDGFSFCPEVTTKISNMGINIMEVPIKYNGRSFKEGKKITYKDGFKAIYTLIKYKYLKN
jgi:dolichol-phosphate mannosyltransferase